jgi:zinc protease
MNILAQRPFARVALALLVGAAMTTSAAAQDSRQSKALPKPQPPKPAIDVPKIKYTEFTLPNGLRVLLHEDHSSPVIAVDLWYKAGSKYDPPGRSGLAHMFEHMLDEGTANMPAGEYKRVIQSVGGYYNAMTQNDIARYWTMAPSNQLETVLWLEAERMANLSPTLDSTRFNLERAAVRNEYRQSVMNIAPNAAAEATIEALFPEGVYAPPLFGYPADINAATVEDLRKFYETYYVPNNAILVVAGDFTVADARRMIQKHFAPIPRGKPVVHPKLVKPFVGEKRIVVEHPQGVRGVWGVWRGAKSSSPDRPALLALSSILSQRLRRLLVEERRLSVVLNPATNQSFDLQEAGIFQVAMTPTPTASATAHEEAMDSVIASIRTDGVTETEVKRWVASYRLQMLTAMQSDTSKAYHLGDGATNMNNPLGVYNLTERALKVTPADVQAAARKYLTTDRLIVSIVPTGKLDLISKPNLPYENRTRKP